MKTRKVGILTLGLTLVAFGVLFLLHFFALPLSYELILRLWPVVFIFMGMEILVHYFHHREDLISIDAGSIVLLLFMAGFAFAMAFMDTLFTYCQAHGF